MEYDPESGEMFEPANTRWIAKLVWSHGLQYTLDRMPAFPYPLAQEVGSPHTQTCVEKQREALWTLVAKRVQAEIDAIKSRNSSGLVKMSEARFHCSCGGEEYTMKAKVVKRESDETSGELQMWVSWKRMVSLEEEKMDLDESPDVTIETKMAELSIVE